MNKSTLVPREEMSDLDWLARNVHKWPTGGHQPWCYVYQKAGKRKVSGNCITVVSPCVKIDKAQWLARRAELQNKPSWNDWPQWDFMAQNRNGCWIISNRELIAGEDGRWHGYGVVTSKGAGEVLGDWRDTLEKRPEQKAFEPFVSIEDNQEQDMTQQQEMKRDNGWFERGELPPVGSSVTVVEVDGLGLSDLGRQFVGEECKVMATFTRPELSHSDAVDVVVVMEQGGGCCCFVLEMIRPIRTERDMLLSIIVEEMNRYDTDGKLADAILAAGFSLGAK